MAGSQPLFSTKRINLNYGVELSKTKIHKNKKMRLFKKIRGLFRMNPNKQKQWVTTDLDCVQERKK